ncbi:hypothetical protein FHS29_000258 [Saccharothrix tamanrassetensis]|uniref:Uncharacterized protein n=1 Tax=Saccharothrix tamanrassetensis TaxID=1051531 RepID=A0A841CBY9_9PSEU|nr:hypothetical protein [Saccharothrix tamanrassetensis]MBB5953688.1 hypothetical protein [Saccharothrix tamanrassetensis]
MPTTDSSWHDGHNEVRDVHGSLIQAGAIHGDVYVGAERDHEVPDIPVFVSVTCRGHDWVRVDGDPPEELPVSGGHEIRVLVQGYGARAVILHELRPVVVSRRPARPATSVGPAAVGALRPRGFTVRLDDPPTLAARGPETFPFTVTQSDPELFVLAPHADDEVEWRLELDWTCADRHGTLVVPEQPLRLHPGRHGGRPRSRP